MGHNDMRASNEWASRPSDQRFLTLDDLYAKVAARREISRTADVALDCMTVQPAEGGEIALASASGVSGLLTNWSFGQLCQRAKAPAGYLRTLPAELACIPLQWSLETHESTADESNDARILVAQNGATHVRAITSTTYGRIWDEQVVRAIRESVDPNVWKVPSASYSAKDPKRATTLYASDRDVFIFLVNEENAIDADGEHVNRGFYVWNSEVGNSSFGIACFTYDYVCDNRIIWGQKDFREMTIRHTAGGPHRFAEKAIPQLNAYAQSSGRVMAETIRAAKAREVGKDRKSVIDWMKARGFTAKVAGKAYEAAEADPRGYNPRSAWGLVQGVTDVAHDLPHTDTRLELEDRAGAILNDMADSL